MFQGLLSMRLASATFLSLMGTLRSALITILEDGLRCFDSKFRVAFCIRYFIFKLRSIVQIYHRSALLKNHDYSYYLPFIRLIHYYTLLEEASSDPILYCERSTCLSCYSRSTTRVRGCYL